MHGPSERAIEAGAGVRAHGVLALAFLAAVSWRPLLHGSSVSDAALTAGFLAGYVLLPGALAWRALRPSADLLSVLALGAALGLALQGLARFALGVVGWEGWFAAWPLVSLPLAWLARRRHVGGPRETAPLSAVQWIALAVLVVLAVERARLYPAWWTERNTDLLFHAGNAAEFSHHWPLENPRVSGLPLTYHFFGYALPAACSEVTGIPIHALCLHQLNGFVPALVALTLVAAARLLGATAAGALLGAFVVVLHADLGHALRELWGSTARGYDFYGLLDTGVFSSPPTAMALVFFLALCVALSGWLDEARTDRGVHLALAALFAGAASATKGSVMPVVIGGSVLFVLVALARGARARPMALATGVIALAAAPMTLWLTLGPESYATAMFQVDFGNLVTRGARAANGGLLAEDASVWMRLGAAPLWLLGYLGTLAPAAWLAARRSATLTRPTIGFLAACAATGLGLAFVLSAPGLSQLFFAYTGQVGLAIAAGEGLALALSARRATDRALGACAWVLLLLGATSAARVLWLEVRRDQAPPPQASAGTVEFARGLEWIRTSTPKDSVLVTRLEAMIASVVAERRTFFETARYSAAMHRTMSSATTVSDPGIERMMRVRQARNEFFAAPSAGRLRAIRELASDRSPLYLVWDDSRPAPEPRAAGTFEFGPCGALPEDVRAALGEPVFENAFIRVFEVTPAGRP